jgi:hypothetical protein
MMRLSNGRGRDGKDSPVTTADDAPEADRPLSDNRLQVALERLTRLQAATAALAQARTPEDVATVLSTQIRAAYGAHGVGLGVLTTDGSALDVIDAHTSFSLTRRRWPLTDDLPFVRAAVDRTVIRLHNRSDRDEAYPWLADQAERTRATVDFPLCTPDGEPIGVLGVGFADDDAVTDDVVADLQTVAELTGSVLQRTRLHLAEQAARRQLQTLQEITSALSSAADQRRVAQVAARQSRLATGALAAAVFECHDHDVTLLATDPAEPGRPGDVGPPLWTLGTPSTDDLWTRQELLPLQAEAALAAAGTAQTAVPRGQGSTRSLGSDVAVLPLVAAGRQLGAMCLRLPPGRLLSAAERDFVRALALLIAEAMGRARLLETERTVARRLSAEAEKARQEADAEAELARRRERSLELERAARFRAEMLQALTERLSGHPGRADLARAIAEATPGALGARTATVLIPDDDRPMIAAVSGHAPDTEAAVRRMLASGARFPVLESLRTGRLITVGSRRDLLRDFPDMAGHPLPFGSVAAVPCHDHAGRPIGALGWGFLEERAFDDDTISLVTAIGARCALALERGAVFDAEQEHARLLAALREAVVRMAAAADVEGVVSAAVGAGPTAVDALEGAVALTADDGSLRLVTTPEPGARVRRAWPAIAVAAEAALGRTGDDAEPVTIEDLAPDGTWVLLPFGTGSAVRGALLLRTGDAPSDDPRRRTLRTTLAEAVGRALGRAISVERAGGGD